MSGRILLSIHAAWWVFDMVMSVRVSAVMFRTAVLAELCDHRHLRIDTNVAWVTAYVDAHVEVVPHKR